MKVKCLVYPLRAPKKPDCNLIVLVFLDSEGFSTKFEYPSTTRPFVGNIFSWPDIC